MILSNISQINNHVIIKDINHHSVTFPISGAIPQKTASASAEPHLLLSLSFRAECSCHFEQRTFCHFERSVLVISSNGLFVISSGARRAKSRNLYITLAMLVIYTARSWQPDLSTRFFGRDDIGVTSSNGLFVILLWCVRISISAFFHPL